jgi:FdhD protein
VLNHETRAVHAAGFYDPSAAWLRFARMSVATTRSTSLAGVAARDGAIARQGLVVLTSRISIEMLQKAAMIGTPLLVAVSPPTALAVRMADACGMTLVAIAR